MAATRDIYAARAVDLDRNISGSVTSPLVACHAEVMLVSGCLFVVIERPSSRHLAKLTADLFYIAVKISFIRVLYVNFTL